MPRRDDIESILVIGSGPIVIGQACEFDYSGSQACRVLRSEGYRVVLANSNPATIMTDPDLAQRTYIEPLDVAVLAAIVERERPDAILPTVGGQTGLNLAMGLLEKGVLAEFDVELIGASAEAISTAEDRDLFKRAMGEIGLEVPPSGFASSLAEAMEVGEVVGFPLMVRPSFILGGAGTGIANDRETLARVAAEGLAASPVSRVLIERSIAGWKEFELEVMRDWCRQLRRRVLDRELRPRRRAHRRLDHRRPGADACRMSSTRPCATMPSPASAASASRQAGPTSSSRFEPTDGRRLVIEMNPRVSRSSALASKATGFPIAKIAGPPRGRLPARRDHQRHHRRNAGELRADNRLRGDQSPALGLREASRERGPARNTHAVGRRGDGHRSDVPRVAAKGAPVPRAGPGRTERRPAGGRLRAPRRRRAHGQGLRADAGAGLSHGGCPQAGRHCRMPSPRPPESIRGSSTSCKGSPLPVDGSRRSPVPAWPGESRPAHLARGKAPRLLRRPDRIPVRRDPGRPGKPPVSERRKCARLDSRRASGRPLRPLTPAVPSSPPALHTTTPPTRTRTR